MKEIYSRNPRTVESTIKKVLPARAVNINQFCRRDIKTAEEFSMKTKRFLVFGLPVVLLAVSALLTMGLAACDTGDGAGTGTNNTGDGPEFLSASFNSGGKTIQFNLQGGEGSSGLSASVMNRSISRAAGLDDGYDLTGVLRDDAVLARLRGSYDPESGNWSVSARSVDDVVYTFEGRVNGTGEFRDANATIVAPSADLNEWEPVFSPVTRREEAGAWDLPGEPEESQASGMPSLALGYWSGSLVAGTAEEISLGCLVSDWKVKVITTAPVEWSVISPYITLVDQNQTIIEVANPEDGVYEVISCYPYYAPTAENYAAAITDWLGLAPENAVAHYEDYPERGDAPDRWVYIDPESGPLCILPTEEFDQLLEFNLAKGWDRWAEEHNVTVAKKYAKYKFEFSDGNNTFDMIQMIEGGGTDGALSPDSYENHYVFDTLAALNAADLTEECRFASDGDNNWENTGVLARTFTRIR
jgi:hypothetical protein